MGLVREKHIAGVRSVSCPVCYRMSPITVMTKVIDGKGGVVSVCRTVGGFAGSCEAQYYKSDNKLIIQEFKNFSW